MAEINKDGGAAAGMCQNCGNEKPCGCGGDIERESAGHYDLTVNDEYLNFKSVEITATDDSRGFSLPTEVSVVKADGTTVENLDANTPLFTFTDSDGNELIVSALCAGQVSSDSFKGGSKSGQFDQYSSLEDLLRDAATKMPENIANEPGVSNFSFDMGKHVGKEGFASLSELLEDGAVSEADMSALDSVREEVESLNRQGDQAANQAFVDEFSSKHPDSKIQFTIMRGSVLVPVVDSPKRDTNQLFMVFGPAGKGKKTAYAISPGRWMPKFPKPEQHRRGGGVVNEETFKESSDAWLNTAVLTGKE